MGRLYRFSLSSSIHIYVNVLINITSSLYNSDLDDTLKGLDLSSICQLATTTAKTTYLQAQGNTSVADQITANCTLVESLMDCLVSNFSCSFMQSYFNGKVNRR